MDKFFNINNPLSVFLSRIADLLLLNIMWLLCCIPVVTIAPATIAFYYVMLKIVRDEDSGITRSFFHSFVDNIRQGIPLSFLFLGVGVILFLDYFFSGILAQPFGLFFRIIFIILSAVFITLCAYTVALQAQFTNTIRQTIKNAIYFSLHHLFRSIVILILHISPVLIMLLAPKLFNSVLPLWIFLAPSIIVFFCAKQFKVIFNPIIEASHNSDP